MTTLAIIDYGIGNLRSVQKAFEHVGATAPLTEDPAVILAADKVVLPGVGAFGDGMKGIHARGLADVVREVVARGTPLLGICVGMQMLLDGSDEGVEPGLGLVRGRALRFPAGVLKVPHMGWNSVRWLADDALNESLRGEARFYFVHSYRAVCEDPASVLGTTVYGGEFASVIRAGRVYGVQFHPEKSHRFGLALLGNFGRA